MHEAIESKSYNQDIRLGVWTVPEQPLTIEQKFSFFFCLCAGLCISTIDFSFREKPEYGLAHAPGRGNQHLRDRGIRTQPDYRVGASAGCVAPRWEGRHIGCRLIPVGRTAILQENKHGPKLVTNR
jgi:hypothetical protein